MRSRAPSPFGYERVAQTKPFSRLLRLPSPAVHAAPPHNAAMKISLFLGGLRPPKPSRGWGKGETRFPHTPRRGLIFTLGRRGEGPRSSTPFRRPPTGCKRIFSGRAAPFHALPRAGAWGNRVSPYPCLRTRPSRRQGRGETGFPHTPAPAVYFHVSRPCGCAAYQEGEKRVVFGREKPSQTLPPGEGWGNQVSPSPCSRKGSSWKGSALPNPSVNDPCSREMSS